MDQQPQDQAASLCSTPQFLLEMLEKINVSEPNTGTGSTDGGPAGAVMPKAAMKPLDVNFFLTNSAKSGGSKGSGGKKVIAAQ